MILVLKKYFFQNTSMWGLVRLFRLTPQNIWYIRHCSNTPHPMFGQTPSVGFVQKVKNLFLIIYAKNSIYGWILLDKNNSFLISTYLKLNHFFPIFVRSSPFSTTCNKKKQFILLQMGQAKGRKEGRKEGRKGGSVALSALRRLMIVQTYWTSSNWPCRREAGNSNPRLRAHSTKNLNIPSSYTQSPNKNVLLEPNVIL